MILFGGFNVGVNISLGDMETALDYINDNEVYRDEIEELKRQKQSNQFNAETTQDIKQESASTFNEVSAVNTEDEDYLDDDTLFEFDDGSEEYEEGYEDSDDDILDEDGEEDYYDDGAYSGILDDEEDIDEDDILGDDEEYTDFDEDSILGEEDDDLDYEDSEGDYYEEQVNKASVVAKSAREIELERQIEELRRDEELRLQQEKLRQEQEEREKAELEARKRERERELELKLEKLKKQREEALRKSTDLDMGRNTYNENLKKDIDSNSNNGSSRGGNPSINTKATINALKQQKERVVNPVKTKAETTPEKEIDYSTLDIEALYKEVKAFMIANGVKTKPLSKSLVEQKFGAQNIKKLYLKGYLIPFGSKLTIGK